MNATVKELVALSIAMVRLGFDPRSEIGLAMEGKGIALVLHKEGNGNVVKVVIPGSKGEDFAGVFKWWSEAFRDILTGEMNEGLVQGVIDGAKCMQKDFADALITKLIECDLLDPRSFQ